MPAPMSDAFLQRVHTAFRRSRTTKWRALEEFDGALEQVRDTWDRPEGGGGDTRILQAGRVIEKGGLNFSAVEGPVHDGLKRQLQTEAGRFAATGVSSVLHPHNPHVPIIHMNVRYFSLDDGTWWFGGGIDLTPHYVVADEARAFHADFEAVCDRHAVGGSSPPSRHGNEIRISYSPHRGESRGVGGIFFDYIGRDGDVDREAALAFCVDLASQYAAIYRRRAEAFVDHPVTEDERRWQGLRRGRYVEFNLVHDRGTRFGLVSGGRTESILMSLPARAEWAYDHQPTEGSREAETLSILRRGEAERIGWARAEPVCPDRESRCICGFAG